MNRIAKPFICPRGEMELETQVYRPYPGNTITTLTWYCADQETGERNELGIFPMSLYAGAIYGLLLFVVIVLGWYLYQRWDALPKSAEAQKWAGWMPTIVVVAIIVCVTLFSLMPLFRSTTTPAPTTIAGATVTSIALTFHEMSSGTPVAFTSTEKPLTNWNGIPIMSQATAGQQVGQDRYTFKVPVDSGTITSFYKDTLKPLGWTLEDDQWLGTKYTKDKNTLLVTLAPATDLQSWVVTLVLIP